MIRSENELGACCELQVTLSSTRVRYGRKWSTAASIYCPKVCQRFFFGDEIFSTLQPLDKGTERRDPLAVLTLFP